MSNILNDNTAKRTIIFRADGNTNIGLGHIYRCIALAEMLEDKFTPEFITRFDSSIEPIIDAKFNYTFLPEGITLLQEPAWFKANYSPDIIIVLDGYGFIESYQKQIKELNFKLAYIDDLAKGTQIADLVINHSPGTIESDYKKENYTDLALGLNYALLRTPFVEFRRNEVKLRKEIRNVFVSFGGTDLNDFSFSTVNEISELEFIDEVNVVIGVSYKHNAIFKLRNPKINIHENITGSEVFRIMVNADLAIVPASTTSIELASLGVPMILGYSSDNQINIYNGFVNKNVVLGVGDYNLFHFKNLRRIISSCNDSDFLRVKSENLLDLFNSNTKANYLRLFQINELIIRKASEIDMKFVYELSNEALVRANSYNSEKIELNKHKKWYKSLMEGTDTLLYIIENRENRIGQVKFSIKENFSVIGISISNSYQGKGYGSKSLNLALETYFKENSLPIYAYIKKSNIASIRAFENAGFNYLKKEDVHGLESYIYIRTKSEN